MSRKKFYLMSDVDSAIGNFSEILLYTLIKAKRMDCNFELVKKNVPFKSVLVKKLGFRQPKALYGIRTDYSAVSNSTGGILLSFYGGIRVFLTYLKASMGYKLAKMINSIFGSKVIEPTFNPRIPSIGSKDLFNIHMEDKFKFNSIDEEYWSSAFEYRFEIGFDGEVTKKCSDSFKKLQLDRYPWYVCLHIRTPFYYQSSHDSFRNSSIKNYYDAIRYIVSLGGAVVRLGDPIPNIENIDGLIDYPSTVYKNEEMDLYLIKNCKFYIGTNSGIFDTAMLFGIPVLCVNTTDYLFPKPYKKSDSMIYKHVFSKENNRILKFKELFENEPFYINSNLMNGSDKDKFLSKYELIENTPEEILTALKNFILNIESKCFEKTEKQQQFENCMKKTIYRWIDTEQYFKNDIDQAYRVFSKLNANGCVDKNFAESHYE